MFDTEIAPIWTERFGRLLLRELELLPKSTGLEVACASGGLAVELLKRMEGEGRLIAVDFSSQLIDLARTKAAGHSGKRIFFRTEGLGARLSFDDEVYDFVVCNLGLDEFTERSTAITEFARVVKPGGWVSATLPVRGSFAEFYDLLREVLLKRDASAALERLEAALAHEPTADQAEGWFRAAGLVDVQFMQEKFTLLFRSSREFFCAPVIEYGPLNEWREIAGSGNEQKEIFAQLQGAIDAYFAERPFGTTVVAGCVQGRKRK